MNLLKKIPKVPLPAWIIQLSAMMGIVIDYVDPHNSISHNLLGYSVIAFSALIALVHLAERYKLINKGTATALETYNPTKGF